MSTNPIFCSKCGSTGSMTLYNNSYLCRTCWEHQPPIITTTLMNLTYAGSQGQNCYKCKKPFDNDHLAIPASGCSSSTFVHGVCWQGCNDGGPHHWETVQPSRWGHRYDYKKCTVCGETSRFI